MKLVFKSICCIVLSLSLQIRSAWADSGFEAWKQGFYKEALKAGISRKVLDKVLPDMDLLERVIKLDTQKPEYVSNFYDYTNRRLSPGRIETGRQMAHKYKTWLSRIEEKYGIPGEYLLALWGMETNYGSYMGNVDMLDSLATLAYHPRRRKFFTGELIGYLKIIQNEKGVAPKTGSWDGGFGHFQFMPTTFLAYAVDGDENGRRDIVNNMPDAFSSAANYLKQMGWNSVEPWGREIIVPDDFDWHKIHKNERKLISDWEKLGISPRHIPAFPDAEKDTMAEWHAPMGKNGPVFLTYPNYRIIMRWNKLSLYAISVGMLADVIKKRYEPIKAPPEFRPFKTKDIICLQEKLTEKGYSTQGFDGQIGPKTRKAITSYQRDNGFAPDGYPSFELLQQMECQNAEN